MTKYSLQTNPYWNEDEEFEYELIAFDSGKVQASFFMSRSDLIKLQELIEKRISK